MAGEADAAGGIGGSSGWKVETRADKGGENDEAPGSQEEDGDDGAVKGPCSSEDDGEAVADGVSGVQGSESAREISHVSPILQHGKLHITFTNM